ncbi:MAG: amino acid adenylation domain-containing protein, partial [bacterium]|nr:amino acid adenylation domain-containing protein [bacterium]
MAYIIYTSGSTGIPKGVMVEHRNVVRLVNHTNYVAFKDGDRILQTGSLTFDASTFEIWGSLLNGMTLCLVSKERILDPGSLKWAITNYRVTTIWMTAPLFNQMLKEDIEIFAGLINLLVGGDVLSPYHINQVRGRFPVLNVINGYGPTENTTFSTTHLIGERNKRSIPIGRPIANSTAYIVNRNRQLQPIGVSGELWVGGDGVSRGYLNDPELTNSKFQIPNKTSALSASSAVIYKTGDLARWRPDGSIKFLGRIDTQVKVRGFRVELGEIESRLKSLDQVTDAVVIARENPGGVRGDKSLYAYYVPVQGDIVTGTAIDISMVKGFLSERLPDFMVPAHIMALETIPLTPNGKVDRRALPEPGLDVPEEYTAPRNKIERALVEVWSQVLNIDKEMIGIDADFFQLGGHSLLATVMITKLHQSLDVKLPLVELFQTPTIRELARYFEKVKKDKFASIGVTEDKEYYPLSPGQKRLYLLHQVDVLSTNYNVPSSVLLEGPINKKKLAETFKQLIQRHDSLRTSFRMMDDVLVQVIHPEIDFEVEYFEPPEISGAPRLSDFIRPFDLSLAPLLRVRLIPKREREHLMMVDMHHIITDGTSMDLFIKEMMALYTGMELPPLKFRYRDYSQWQSSDIQREASRQQEQYWLTQFEGEIPVLQLPTDYSRPANRDFEGALLKFHLSPQQVSGLSHLVSETGATLYMALFTIYTILLSKVSGQEDIVVGTPVAGRRHVDLEAIIGMFVNTLAVRHYPTGWKTAKDFLKEVKERTVAAFDNQEYPFEDLVDHLVKDRDTSRNPLFDVMFSLSNMEAQTGDIPVVEMAELKISPYESHHRTAKFDLSLNCIEAGERIDCAFEYRTRLFKQKTIQRFRNYFLEIVSAVTVNTGAALAEITIISEQERHQLLYAFNDTQADYPLDKTLHQLFEEQAGRTPTAIAVVASREIPATEKTDRLSYRQLNGKAGQLAHRLREKGVTPDTIVGIMTERSLEMILGIMGILKSGGAYMPIDPASPSKRVDYMLRDSGAKVIVTNDLMVDGLDGLIVNRLNSSGGPTDQPINQQTGKPTNLSYVLYTSGSTGKPKGVMIDHSSAVNLVYGLEERIYRRAHSPLHVALVAPYVFDASVQQIFGSLSLGHRLVIVPEATRTDGGGLLEFYRHHRIHLTDGTPMHLQLMAEFMLENSVSPPESLRYLLIGGEALPGDVVKKFFDVFRHGHPQTPHPVTIINLYGPTECAVDSTSYGITREPHSDRNTPDFPLTIPIGVPMPNVRVVVLSPYGTLQPLGVPGELALDGAGVGRGYLNQPELTAERYLEINISPLGNEISLIRNKVSLLRRKISVIGNKMYKTGDLVRWLHDGNIEFLGRLDHQVKVRGYRIELGEIENQLRNHEQLKDAVVVTHRDKHGTNRLCAYYIPVLGDVVSPSEGVDLTELRHYLSRLFPDYMIPSYFMALEKLPLNSSGKIDRNALPEPVPEAGEGYVAPRDVIEKKLVDIWMEILEIRSSRAVGIDTGFFQLGGQSLTAMYMAGKIHKTFNVRLTLQEVFRAPRIRELAQLIKNMPEARYVSLQPVEEREYYRLSSAQKRLYIMHRMEPGSIAYNMPHAFELEGHIDIER